MMEFVILTISFTVALLVSSGLSMFIMFKLMSSPKFMKRYMNWFMKQMKNYEDLAEELMEEEL